ncbi:MAG TPA: endonuclease III [Tepidisphaeraceae bacterium]|jgi:endonuclease-3|nr:endonuclease III [Tepidisphaeraceae bacterium]
MPRKISRKSLDRKHRVAAILPILKRTYPTAKCSLDHTSPLQLLVATILSAQSTDARVNIVTRDLFQKYKSARDLASVSQERLEEDIRSTGFYRNKAKSIRAMAQALIDHHGGEVPRTMEALFDLPGVGRKTANVVLGNAFGINVGITVDTHVTRLANRLKLTDYASDAVKIEQDLMPLVPQEDWALWSHLLIFHGRAICTARNPKCEKCPILEFCPTGKKLVAERKSENSKLKA